MKRALALGTTLILSLTPGPAGADPGHRAPKITVLKFLQQPLKAGIDEVLKVVAHDPDSWISEVQVNYEDDNGNGGVVFAHTYCVQDPDFSDPGTPAKLRIPIHFANPGNYHMQVRAISSKKCAGGQTSKTSRTLERDLVVVETLESASDPDDTSGPFDIAALEQTQEGSQTSATTEIVHRIKTFESWEDGALGGAARMEISFDLDGDPNTIERVLPIDLDERDGEIRAPMLDQSSGQERGYAAVLRPDENTLEVRFPPALLQEGTREYNWFVTTDAGENEPCTFESPCIDLGPDATMMRHRL